MKKLALFALLLGVGFSACNANTNTKEDKKIETTAKATTIHLTKAEFLKKVADYEKNPSEWKYLGDKPAIIDFYASWCGPCKKLGPVLEELAKEYAGEIYIYKVNTEKEPELARAFGIQSIPTLIFAPMNAQPQVAQGALPKEELQKAIREVLLKK